MNILTSFVRLVIFIIVCVFSIILVVSNTADISFSLHPFPIEFSVPLYLAIGVSFLSGFLVSGLILYGHRSSVLRSLRAENKQLQKDIKANKDKKSLISKLPSNNAISEEKNAVEQKIMIT